MIANKELVFQNEEKEKRANEFFRANEKLILQNMEIEQFAYIASHDLQEPLRTIINYTGLFNKRYQGKLDENADKFLAAISGATSRMQSLIRDLLDYSRIEKGTAKAEVDCNLLLKEISDDLAVSLTDSGTKIIADDLPVISGYVSGVKSLFQNLISNAIKFKRNGVAPVIKITAESKETEWLFVISDNGIGIKKEFYNKLFIIFQRLHNKEEYPGTGIGLAQCKKIVELHGGEIRVESEYGKGSNFYFTISKNL